MSANKQPISGNTQDLTVQPWTPNILSYWPSQLHFISPFLLLVSYSACGHWWWIPIVAPFLGAIAGVMVYQLMIGCHDEPPPEANDEESVKLSNVKQRDNVWSCWAMHLLLGQFFLKKEDKNLKTEKNQSRKQNVLTTGVWSLLHTYFFV